jgi:hypothetical protein
MKLKDKREEQMATLPKTISERKAALEVYAKH